MGILIGGKTPQSIEIGGKAVQSLAIGGEVVWSAAPQIPDYMRLKNISNESGVFKMVKTGSPTAPNLEYSLDGTTWTTYDFSTLPEVQVAAGETIYFRGTNANQQFNTSSYDFVKFSFDKTCEGHGNMCSLLDPDPAVFSTITSVGNYGLCYLFNGCTSLTTAPDLSNVTTVNNSGVRNCFYGCTSLTTAPDFSNITSVDSYGLQSCFSNCSSLVNAPDFSNLTSVGMYGLGYCFSSCSSLVNAPDFSNLTSVSYYGLQECFTGCNSLVTGPDLSNVTSVSSYGLQKLFAFSNKVSDVTAPNLSDLTSNDILRYWLMSAGSQATGTKVVRVPTGATISTGDSGIPSDWTRVDY